MTSKSTKKNFPQFEPAVRRSKLEDKVEDQLKTLGIDYQYEPHYLKYTIPEHEHRYLPDFLLPNGIYLEVKGTFQRHGVGGSAAERRKLILVKQRNPTIDLRIVFSKASQPIYKGSPTTLAKWAEDHGFKYADNGTIPTSWLEGLLNNADSNSGGSTPPR